MSKHHLLLVLVTACGFVQAQALSTEAWQTVTDGRGIQRVHISCGPDFFDPREIVVRSNVPVELSVRTSAPDQEFVSGFSARTPIGKQPTAHTFIPTASGHFPLLCQKRGSAQDPRASARNRGLLTVVPAVLER